MNGKDIGFQDYHSNLSKRLLEVFSAEENGFLIGIDRGINPKYYKEYTRKHVKWLKNHYKYAEYIYGIIEEEKNYYNSMISRFWIPLKYKSESYRIVSLFKQIWNGRDIIIIEGDKTRMGMGNDLFDNVSDCKRIVCPSVNAFDRYDEILQASLTQPKTSLVLIALGPTATVLAYDLYKMGYQAIDIGHMDLEYEWMRMVSNEKTLISNKYVNEVSGGNEVSDNVDDSYLNQIIFRIQ